MNKTKAEEHLEHLKELNAMRQQLDLLRERHAINNYLANVLNGLTVNVLGINGGKEQLDRTRRILDDVNQCVLRLMTPWLDRDPGESLLSQLDKLRHHFNAEAKEHETLENVSPKTKDQLIHKGQRIAYNHIVRHLDKLVLTDRKEEKP